MASPILFQGTLTRPWQTLDPFLFSMHHLDAYPVGTEDQTPAASLSGRNIGSDFSYKDGWSMYHGDAVPGFPKHPHRGFETITVLRQGLVDHSDSMGATARYGAGDVQWMTAGDGIEHAEMFPLTQTDADNPLELFQIWLNLPARSKRVKPHFTMMWSETVPTIHEPGVELRLIAGEYADQRAPAPPPDSWAADPRSEVAIYTVKLDHQASMDLPAAASGVNTALYVIGGEGIEIDGHFVPSGQWVQLAAETRLRIFNPGSKADFAVLRGRPIGEPVVKYGPFVMNTKEEIRQAFMDYQAGRFGRWPWKNSAPVHQRNDTRFAVHADGRTERPPKA